MSSLRLCTVIDGYEILGDACDLENCGAGTVFLPRVDKAVNGRTSTEPEFHFKVSTTVSFSETSMLSCFVFPTCFIHI